MSKPDDDTDVPSGLKDDARMERTPIPASPQMVIISSPAPTSTSVQTASPRTLGAADEEDAFTVEARPPAEKTQPPTPPPARPVAQESPGQQLVRMAFGVKGPPTPSQFNGSVTGMEVDDTRANQTYHSNDETEPLSMSQGQKIVHALSTKIHMSDLAQHEG